MPSYISHAIMGEQLYNELNQDGNIFKTDISKEEVRGYSLGADLAYPSPKLKKDPQNFCTRDFFINIIEYIKENKLTENKHAISLLYGHIAHYFLDINTHPLIYYIEQGCQKVSSITNHDLVEGYLNSYLTNKILGKNIMDIKSNYFNQVELSNKETTKLLNTVYGKIYGDPKIIDTYKAVITIFSIIENVLKCGSLSADNLIQLSNFKRFLEKNDLTKEEITNTSNATYTNPVTGEKHNESFIELYDRSIDMSLDAIKRVNNCLYSSTPISSLDKVFTDLSYDTGVNCSLGKKMTYVRKRIKKQ